MPMETTATVEQADGRGHRRRSRWRNGKFLVLFLAVATLLGGAGLMAPRFQEKASAANDGRDIKWDILDGNAGAAKYANMIEAVKRRTSLDSFVRDDTHRTRPEAVNDFFTVDITVQDEGTSTPNRIRVQIRASDLFVVGWLNLNDSV